MKILEKSGKTTSVAAAGSEQTLASIGVPANLLGKNGVLRLTLFWDVSPTASAKHIRTYLGTALLQDVNLNAAPVQSSVSQLTVLNLDNTAEQVSAPRTTPPAALGASPDPLVMSAVDMKQNQVLRITGEKADAGDEIYLRGYIVEYAF